MAPVVLEAVAGSAAKEYKKESATARLLGSGMIYLNPRLRRITDMLRVCWNC